MRNPSDALQWIIACAAAFALLAAMGVAMYLVEQEKRACAQRCFPKAASGGGEFCYCVLDREAPR